MRLIQFGSSREDGDRIICVEEYSLPDEPKEESKAAIFGRGNGKKSVNSTSGVPVAACVESAGA